MNLLTKLPHWLAKQGSELDKLRKAAVVFWERFCDLLAWQSQQLDPMTAELQLVHLLAWERDVDQLPEESEQMYRTRVKFALPFAKGAGSKAGWLDMFEKLNLTSINIVERYDVVNWDVIFVQLLDQELNDNKQLLTYLCRKYGRTTRRYELQTIASLTAFTSATAFSLESAIVIATIYGNQYGAIANVNALAAVTVFSSENLTVIAKTN